MRGVVFDWYRSMFFGFLVVSGISESMADNGMAISAQMESLGGPLCPGSTVRIHCVHTSTSHNPGWRVRGEGLPKLGYAQFGLPPLVNHTLDQESKEVEILTIEAVKNTYDGFQYSCLYSILGRDVVSNPPVTLRVIDTLSSVSNLEVSKVSQASAHLTWEHNDTCDVLDYYSVTLEGDTREYKVLHPSFMVKDLDSEREYTAQVSFFTKSGEQSAIGKVTFKTSGQANLKTEHSKTEVSISSDHMETNIFYYLLPIAGGMIIIVIVVLGVLAVVLMQRRASHNKTSQMVKA